MLLSIEDRLPGTFEILRGVSDFPRLREEAAHRIWKGYHRKEEGSDSSKEA